MSGFCAHMLENMRRLSTPFTRGEREFTPLLATSLEQEPEYAPALRGTFHLPSGSRTLPYSPIFLLAGAAEKVTRRLNGSAMVPTASMMPATDDSATPTSSTDTVDGVPAPSSHTSPHTSPRPSIETPPSEGARAKRESRDTWPAKHAASITVDVPELRPSQSTCAPRMTIEHPAVREWIENLGDGENAKLPLPEDNDVYVTLGLHYMDKPLEHSHWLFFGDRDAGLRRRTIYKMDRLIRQGVNVEGTEYWPGCNDALARVQRVRYEEHAHARLYREGISWYYMLNFGWLQPPPEPKRKRNTPKATEPKKSSSSKKAATRGTTKGKGHTATNESASSSNGKKRAAPSESTEDAPGAKKPRVSSSPAKSSRKRARDDDEGGDDMHDAKRVRASSSTPPAVRRSSRVAAKRVPASLESEIIQSASPPPIQSIGVPQVEVTPPAEYAESHVGLDVEMADSPDERMSEDVDAPAKRTRHASARLRDSASPDLLKAPMLRTRRAKGRVRA